MKKLLMFFSAVLFLQIATAQFCPGNIFTNGDLEQGTPTNNHQDIALATGYDGIWTGGSLADFYIATAGPFSDPTPPSGNYAGCWIWNRPDDNATFREGFRNELNTVIMPNTGTYCLTFDMACKGGGWGTPELGVYGISNPSNGFPGTPTAMFTPSNSDLYGAANTFHLGDRLVTGPCNGTKTTQTIIFNSASPGFPAGGLTHIFLTHSDNAFSAGRYVGFDDFCLKSIPCGEVVNETIECVDGGYNYTFEVLNNSGLTVDGIDITIPGLGYDPLAVVPTGTTYGPVTVFIPASQMGTYCFDILMYSGIVECCHIDHCIDLPDCDPCDDILLFVNDVSTDGDDCCYEVSVSNNFSNDYFTSIVTTILTPGVNFENPTTNGNWTVTPTTGNVLTWAPPTPFLGQVSYLNPINFCFSQILQTSQMPQIVVFDWMTLDQNGQDSIACSDTLTFNCEPCLMIDNKSIKCLDDGTFEYCFSVTNNGPDPATQLYLDPYGPAGTTFTPNPVPVNLAPGASDEYCVNISGVNSGDIVEYKALLKSYLGDTLNWCCIVDTFRVEIPECDDDCKCDDEFDERVAQGYQILYSINSCKVGLFPLGLDDCYKVRWTVNGVPQAVTMGNEIWYTELPYWTVKICMEVYIPDTECYATFCRKLKCTFEGNDGPGGDGGGDLSWKVLQEEEGAGGLTIKNLYPNPVSDLLNVKLGQHLSDQRLNIQIVNSMGEVVLTKSNQAVSNDEIQINVERLSEGVYFLKVEGTDAQSDFLKFVKLR